MLHRAACPQISPEFRDGWQGLCTVAAPSPVFRRVAQCRPPRCPLGMVTTCGRHHGAHDERRGRSTAAAYDVAV